MTHIGPPNQACYARKFVHQFLCVNFAYAHSYVPIAIHKTFLRTKNRKFVRKYTHDLSCRTTENFRKDNELMTLPRCLVLESQHVGLIARGSSDQILQIAVTSEYVNSLVEIRSVTSRDWASKKRKTTAVKYKNKKLSECNFITKHNVHLYTIKNPLVSTSAEFFSPMILMMILIRHSKLTTTVYR